LLPTSRRRFGACTSGRDPYYEAFDDEVSRAEQIYHHLCLGDPRVFPSLEQRWTRTVAPLLADAIDEVPDVSRPWLAAMTGQSISSEERNAAGDPERTSIVGHEVQFLFRLGRFEKAPR
jgi:hypothetical protein